jgi:hypothetical protein
VACDPDQQDCQRGAPYDAAEHGPVPRRVYQPLCVLARAVRAREGRGAPGGAVSHHGAGALVRRPLATVRIAKFDAPDSLTEGEQLSVYLLLRRRRDLRLQPPDQRQQGEIVDGAARTIGVTLEARDRA